MSHAQLSLPLIADACTETPAGKASAGKASAGKASGNDGAVVDEPGGPPKPNHQDEQCAPLSGSALAPLEPECPPGLAALYLDFDSFFASAEQHLQPALRGRPVGVTPLPSEGTSLIAASREAKRLGLKVGTPVREARRLCPGIAIIPARPDAYVRLHHAILAVIGTVVPIHAVRSIDEVVCRLLLNEQRRAVGLARTIKLRLAKDIGPVLTCSIGLAPTETLAKIAAEMRKPDGLVVVRAEDLPAALDGLKLNDIPGIGPGNADRLARAGVQDVAGLMALAPKQMRALWGNVEGERLWAALHGTECERPVTQRSMFGHSRVLPRRGMTYDDLRPVARLLVVKAARRLRREHFLARTLSLRLRLQDGDWGAALRFLAVRDDRSFLQALDRLLEQALRAGVLNRARNIAVMLTDIVAVADKEQDLLAEREEDAGQARWEILSEMGDRLSARYGYAALRLGLQKQPPGGYAGGKIAFGRIPDLHDFDQADPDSSPKKPRRQ
ncbi:MAG: Y-family DNA polymerase [Beijerinckiaceae bacterium]